MSSIPVELVADIRADVGEGPSWDDQSQTLLFVDVSPGAVYRLDPMDGSTTRFHVGQEIGAAIPRAGGGLVLAVRDGIYTSDGEGGSISLFAPIGADRPEVRMNDAKCDPFGRLWAGSMAFDFADGAADLYRVEPSGEVTTVLPGVTISNGLGWSPDASSMYYIDSATYCIDVLDYDLATGAATERRPFVQNDEDHGMPDGMAVDSEGGVWVAYFYGGQVRRYAPDGAVTEIVDLPVRQVTSCCFGGADLGDLYITSSAYDLRAADLVDQPLAGGTFVCRPGVTGQPTARFGASS